MSKQENSDKLIDALHAYRNDADTTPKLAEIIRDVVREEVAAAKKKK